MTRTVIIADPGPALDRLIGALDATPGVELVGVLTHRARIASRLARTRPDLIFIDEPAWPRTPLALLPEVRDAAAAAVIVRAADPTATWLAEALLAGATAVLPAVVDEATLRRVVLEVIAAKAPTHDHARIARAA